MGTQTPNAVCNPSGAGMRYLGPALPAADGCDPEGRPYDLSRVVVNFANVGSTYGEKVMKRNRHFGQRLFDYEGVRRCVQHLTQKRELLVIGVVYENFWA